MKRKLILFLPRLAIALSLVGGLALARSVWASPSVTGSTCGGGSFKSDNWSDGESERSMSWSDTPGFNCTNGVAEAQAQIKAGQYEGGPNACFGFDWDQGGWSVFEKWDSEEEKNANGCQDISNVVITWVCECPPPTTTSTTTDPATPTETEVPTDTATPTETNTPGGPTETPTPTNTKGPSPTPTNTQEQPRPTRTPQPGPISGGEGPSGSDDVPWLIISIGATSLVAILTFLAAMIRRKASLL